MAKVSVGDAHMESRDDVVECLSSFSDSMSMSIHCFNAHAGAFGKRDFVRAYPKADMFVIFWNNSLARDITSEKSASFNRVLGIELSRNQRDGCQPGSKRASDLLADEEGFTYAEIETFEGKLFVYILFDLPHANESYDLLYQIMTKVAEKLGKEVAPREMTDLARKRLVQRYQTFIKQGVNSSIQQFEQQIAACQRSRDSYRLHYTQTYEQEREYQARIEALKMNGDKDTTKIEKEIDKICAHPKIQSMNVMRGVMTVETKELTYRDRSKALRKLGAFRITIHPEREPVVQRITTLEDNDRVYGYVTRFAHPHSTGRGNAMCWGNIGAGIIQLALDKEYFTLIDLVIQFLLNINEDDPYGQRVQYWPIIPEEGAPTPVVAETARVRTRR